MAFDFNGTTDRIDYGNVATLTGSAFTVSSWVYPDNVSTGTQYIWCSHDPGNTSVGLLFNMNPGGVGAGCLQVTRIGSTSVSRGVVTGDATILTAGSWQHALTTVDNSGNISGIHFYRNAVEAVAYTTVAPGPLVGETTHSGSWGIGGRIPDDIRNWDGRLAEIAVWNFVLTQAEITLLSKGFSPLFIRPESLIFYAPLIRAQADRIAGQAGTLDGTSVIEHPRVIYPHRSAFAWETPVGGGPPPSTVRTPRMGGYRIGGFRVRAA